MAKNFGLLRAALPSEARARAEALTAKMSSDLALHQLRQVRGFSQANVADTLAVKQPAVAKMERREDMHISTLRDFVRAIGGALHIFAEFPDGMARIQNLSDVRETISALANYEIELGSAPVGNSHPWRDDQAWALATCSKSNLKSATYAISASVGVPAVFHIKDAPIRYVAPRATKPAAISPTTGRPKALLQILAMESRSI
jgi:predicted XRE-type DNA-binding protein